MISFWGAQRGLTASYIVTTHRHINPLLEMPLQVVAMEGLAPFNLFTRDTRQYLENEKKTAHLSS